MPLSICNIIKREVRQTDTYALSLAHCPAKSSWLHVSGHSYEYMLKELSTENLSGKTSRGTLLVANRSRIILGGTVRSVGTSKQWHYPDSGYKFFIAMESLDDIGYITNNSPVRMRVFTSVWIITFFGKLAACTRPFSMGAMWRDWLQENSNMCLI